MLTDLIFEYDFDIYIDISVILLQLVLSPCLDWISYISLSFPEGLQVLAVIGSDRNSHWTAWLLYSGHSLCILLHNGNNRVENSYLNLLIGRVLFKI